ncbi:GNAT family N-acetyltransferase [Streptomyces kaniharaensis]|uniref:GNAT family N-acetyltransferase n=1 Tax=Streptomyces kaniharaensis TaxID=212423 RepID=A0A6N7KUN3_9ACTN|nr:GNAT family N-acetyltransferase [Streptomyces kaniharaensis]MQS14545.1 GNAT family N-acetyltransferase [Streptomyces kaniharaensis]
MPILITDRLILRHFTEADADDLAALHADPAVMRLIDDGRPVPPAVTATVTLPSILRDYRELPPGQGQFAAVTRTGYRFLGWLSLRPASSVGLTAATGDLELGYRLHPADWGRGYATEGARALVRHAFLNLDAARVVATTMTVNTASRRVMEKAELRHVRTFHEDWPDPLPGAEHGDVEYALARADWSAEIR